MSSREEEKAIEDAGGIVDDIDMSKAKPGKKTKVNMDSATIGQMVYLNRQMEIVRDKFAKKFEGNGLEFNITVVTAGRGKPGLSGSIWTK